jgi:hypothetical protein
VFKCAFGVTQVGGQFACRWAETVVRRGGPEVACTSEDAHVRCEALFQHMKAAALPAFGVEDDLLSMPHSVQVKIQFGGLLGLRRLLGVADGAAPDVADVDALVRQGTQRYGGVEQIPCGELVGDMTGYKLKRRGAAS